MDVWVDGAMLLHTGDLQVYNGFYKTCDQMASSFGVLQAMRVDIWSDSAPR